VNHWTGSQLTPADVTGVWAGLRPLLSASDGEKISERTADLSRRHQVSDDGDGVIHVTGGKWTTYRQMAEDAVNVLSTYFPGIPRRLTRHAAILGSERPGSLAGDDLHLHRRYGTLRHAVTALIAENPALSERPIDGLPYLAAEFLYAAQSEMALTLEDVLTRRTRAHLMDARATWRSAERIAHIIAPALGWDSVRVTREVENYRALVAREFANANLPLETA
jgi:glycerol-3-phosphate dehydrogenase